MTFRRSLHALSLLALLAGQPLTALAQETPKAPPVIEGAEAAIGAMYPTLVLIRVVMEEGEDGRMKETLIVRSEAVVCREFNGSGAPLAIGASG